MRNARNHKSTRSNEQSFAINVRWIAGLAFLLIGMAAAAILSAKHIWAISLLGCGSGGGCDGLISGRWGKVFGWPAAFIGLAYFCMMLWLWWQNRRTAPALAIQILAWLACAVSMLYIGLMIGQRQMCLWCSLVHLANFGMLGIIWGYARRTAGRKAATSGQYSVAALIFLAVLLGLKIAESEERLKTDAERHAEAVESISKVDAGENASSPSGADDGSAGFGGRYWLGAENPTVRVVMFHDHRCELCSEAEGKILEVLKSRRDVAFSVKQWPFDSLCNPQMFGASPHPGACLAARMAEAAGLLGGSDAFWRMHKWLVEKGGRVDADEAVAYAKEIGLDPEKFRAAMNSPDVEDFIQADISEGTAYGLASTPMIFVNGYHLQGWQSPGALPAMIERVGQYAATHPRVSDQPDSAAMLEYKKWADAPVVSVGVDGRFALYGSADAPITITVFGDVTCQYFSAAMINIDRAVKDRTDVKVILRHFPLDGDCNPQVTRVINPLACEGSALVEGAALIGGEAAFRKATRWMIANRATLGTNMGSLLAAELEVDPEKLKSAAGEAAVSRRIGENVTTAKTLGVNTSPTIYVNGRRVFNWRAPGVFERILSSARQTQ